MNEYELNLDTITLPLSNMDGATITTFTQAEWGATKAAFFQADEERARFWSMGMYARRCVKVPVRPFLKNLMV